MAVAIGSFARGHSVFIWFFLYENEELRKNLSIVYQ